MMIRIRIPITNRKEDKIIICPERFFGPDGPQDQMDIYPNNWIKL